MNDLHIIGDIVIGSIIWSALRLIITKAFLEPGATWLGQTAYKKTDELFNDKLPDFFDK